jgi:UDP-N-acetylglucosamine 3-dehydrogenase
VPDVRLGLIGCGLIAERGYLPALRRAKGVRLAAVADSVAERCVKLAPDVPAFAGVAELLAAHAADALILATPARAHLPDAAAAAAAGVPVLIEKPPAPTVRETEELVRLTPLPFVGFNRRFEPELRELRAAAAAAPRVDIRLVFRRRRGSWPSHESADPVALDLGPHLVDLAFWLSGAGAERVSGHADESRLSMEIELADGRGTATVECELGPPYRELVQVRGLGSFKRGGLLAALQSGESPLVGSLARQLEAFARAVRGESEAELGTAHDGLRVMRALESVTS